MTGLTLLADTVDAKRMSRAAAGAIDRAQKSSGATRGEAPPGWDNCPRFLPFQFF
jgi:hypothetical protein